jgi:hypothetical protein
MLHRGRLKPWPIKSTSMHPHTRNDLCPHRIAIFTPSLTIHRMMFLFSDRYSEVTGLVPLIFISYFYIPEVPCISHKKGQGSSLFIIIIIYVLTYKIYFMYYIIHINILYKYALLIFK